MPNSSEDHILALIDQHFPQHHPRLSVGRGDDCCVLSADTPLAISTDLFMEDIHFRRSYFTGFDIGWKALAVNISDLAAEGARPIGFSLGLALPYDATETLIDDIFSGMAELARPLNLALTGGDLSRAEKLHLCITVFGDVGAHEILERKKAKPGDVIFICGELGLARAGLHALEKYGPQACASFPQLCNAHLRPQPKVAEGLKIAALRAQFGARVSLMDISDGPARDLPRLIGSFGANVTLPEPDEQLAAYAGDKAHTMMWLGGEDYALLGTCDTEHLDKLFAAIPTVRTIGIVTDKNIIWNGHKLDDSDGFDHFS